MTDRALVMAVYVYQLYRIAAKMTKLCLHGRKLLIYSRSRYASPGQTVKKTVAIRNIEQGAGGCLG